MEQAFKGSYHTTPDKALHGWAERESSVMEVGGDLLTLKGMKSFTPKPKTPLAFQDSLFGKKNLIERNTVNPGKYGEPSVDYFLETGDACDNS